MKLLKTAFAIGIAAIALQAHAVSIAGLVNTGVGLANGAVDTNYSFASTGGTATGTGGYGVVANGGGFPFPYWIANTATSQWLAPSANQAESYDPSADGTYTWTLKFDLTGYAASSASFSGQWAADNRGELFFNGSLVSQTSGFPGYQGHSAWSPTFSVNSGFNAGVNTLEFHVLNLGQNGGNPTGLRTEFMSNVTAVPEPETYALMLAGLAAVVFVARRRQPR